MTGRFDVAVFEGDGTSRKDLAAAGIGVRRSRHRVHLAGRGEPRRRACSRGARRKEPRPSSGRRASSTSSSGARASSTSTSSSRPSSRRPTRSAASSACPAARQTDVFADGQVQVGEFDVDEDASPHDRRSPVPRCRDPAGLEGRCRSSAARRPILPGGDDEIRTGDRIVVIGSPRAIKAGARFSGPRAARCATS